MVVGCDITHGIPRVTNGVKCHCTACHDLVGVKCVQRCAAVKHAL